MSSTPHDPFYSSPFGPFYRRHTPYMVQPEYRIYEMNKRLQSRTEDSDNLWWDAFATEFFEDDATLTLSFCLEDGPKRYKSPCCSIHPGPYSPDGSGLPPQIGYDRNCRWRLLLSS
uniref:LIM domain binding 2 n=1 Tax=Bos mutus grunniens TaxID=30521 RepID=A0A8B9YDT8_BOSMU